MSTQLAKRPNETRSADPWDKWPNESFQQYAAFCDYRKLDGSTAENFDFISRKYCWDLDTVHKLQKEYSWSSRRSGFRKHLLELEAQAWEAEKQSMLKRHAVVGQEFVDRAV